MPCCRVLAMHDNDNAYCDAICNKRWSLVCVCILLVQRCSIHTWLM